jgi:hypothetical protein
VEVPLARTNFEFQKRQKELEKKRKKEEKKLKTGTAAEPAAEGTEALKRPQPPTPPPSCGLSAAAPE